MLSSPVASCLRRIHLIQFEINLIVAGSSVNTVYCDTSVISDEGRDPSARQPGGGGSLWPGSWALQGEE